MRQIIGYLTQHWPLYSNFMGTFSTLLTELCTENLLADVIGCRPSISNHNNKCQEMSGDGIRENEQKICRCISCISTSNVSIILVQNHRDVVVVRRYCGCGLPYGIHVPSVRHFLWLYGEPAVVVNIIELTGVASSM